MTYLLKRKFAKKGNNFTTFGSLTFKGTVVSGFSSANYLKLPNVVPLATADSWEKVVKFTYKTTGSNIQAFITTTNDGGGSEEYIGASTVLFYRTAVDTSSVLFIITGSTVLVDGNTYWGKIEFTGDTYNLYLSTTGKFNGEETLEGSYSSTTKCLSRNHYIGNTLISGYEYISTSSIDLSECYININGERWWSPFFDYYEPKNYLLRKFGEKKYYKYSTQQVGWTQPKLTSNNMAVTGGNIVCTASSNYGNNTDIYKIMLGSVSSAVDKDYWQVNGSTSAQWVQIKFPYKLRITGLSVYTRPSDNFTRTVRAYTSSSKTTQIGSAINTSAGATKYTFLSNGSGIETDTIYLSIDAGNDNNKWYGLQNLQITATTGRQIVVDGTSDSYDFSTTEIKNYVLKVPPKSYAFTINAMPENAVITINNEETSTLKALQGSTINWSVSADGYKTKSGSLVLNEDTTLDIELEEQPEGELLFAHYASSDGMEHFYAKAPLGEDFIKYGVDFIGSREATDISEIQPVVSPGNGATQYWEYVTEDYAEQDGILTYYREAGGDFYGSTPEAE